MQGAAEKLEHCIDLLYGALTAPDKFVDAVRAIRVTFGASGATHLHFTQRGELAGIVDDGHDPDAQRLYVERYAAIDPTRSLLTLRSGEWLWDDRLLDPCHTTEPEFVNDFAPGIGMRYFMGCKLFHDARGIATFSLQRPSDAKPFDGETFALMQQLQPHLKRAFRLLLETVPAMPALASGAAAMDVLSIAACVVDSGCRIVYANLAAEGLFRRSAMVNATGGKLSCVSAQANEMLRRAVMRAAWPPRRASAFSPEPHAAPVTRLQVRAIPLAPHLGLASYGSSDLVLLFLASGAVPPDTRELQELFGLTPAEADLVRLLVQGASVELCARWRSVSVATVRTQLKHIFAKTGAESQSQLIGMALALPPLASTRPSVRPHTSNG